MENINTKIQKWLKAKANSISKRIESGILENKQLKCQVVFGPVYSRKLGYVLGINNQRSKMCSYNCIYCPQKEKSCCTISSERCLSEYELFVAVKNKLDEINRNGKKVDYILFSGSGDPVLDGNLPREISILRQFGYKIAVYTNSALFYNQNVQENLLFADIVCIKIDSTNEVTWHKINRPHPRLRFNLILQGVQQFARKFKGTLFTETMLIKGFNDNKEEIESLARFLNSLTHKASYFITPMYPPDEFYVETPDSHKLELLKEAITKMVNNPVLLCCLENEDFFSTDDFENELLGLLTVHPVEADAVKSFIKKSEDINTLNNLIFTNRISITEYRGKEYFTTVPNKSTLNN